jgi:two-component system sensor histidine kinase KdpD
MVQHTTQFKATQLIVGQSLKPKWWSLRRSSVVHHLLRKARHIDMLIVADFNQQLTLEPK